MIRRLALRSALLGVALASGIVQAAVGQESAAPSATASAQASPAAETRLDSIERGPIPAGRYADRSMGRDISFSIGDGWVSDGPIEDAGFALIREEAGSPYFAIAPFHGGVFPAGCPDMSDPAQAEAFEQGITSIEPSAAAFIEHVSAMPELTVTEAMPAEVAGFSGLQLDVTSVDVTDDCDPPWAWLMTLPQVGDYHLSEGVLARVVAFDADRQTLVAFMEINPDGDVQAFYDLGTAILGSLEIGPLGG
jgi:hypothetical protein